MVLSHQKPPATTPAAKWISVDHDGGLLAMPVRDGYADLDRAVLLRGTARAVLEGLQEGQDTGELAATLEREGAPSAEQARADAERFVRELQERGFGADGEDETGAPTDEGGTIEADELDRLARSALAAGCRLHFRAHGRSMRPQIPHGSLLEVAGVPYDELGSGDVALYSVDGRRLVAHRVLRRESEHFTARGDTSARLDRVARSEYIGRVESCRPAGEVWRPLDTRWRKRLGLWTGRVYLAAVAVVRTLFLRPLGGSSGPSRAMRAVLSGCARLASGVLLRTERWSQAWRAPIDRLRAALHSTEEKDRARSELYQRRAVVGFTALDENVQAGLTLLEEHLFHDHTLEPGRALVLGCGPGRECAALYERGFEVVGIDREPAMIECARANAERGGWNIAYEIGDAVQFHVEGEPFDYVVVFSGLYNMVLPASRRIEMLRSARRHLCPGGRVLLTFLSAYHDPDSPPPGAGKTVLEALNAEHQAGDVYLINEVVHVFPHVERLREEISSAELELVAMYRDQRAYQRREGNVRGYVILRRP